MRVMISLRMTTGGGAAGRQAAGGGGGRVRRKRNENIHTDDGWSLSIFLRRLAVLGGGELTLITNIIIIIITFITIIIIIIQAITILKLNPSQSFLIAF